MIVEEQILDMLRMKTINTNFITANNTTTNDVFTIDARGPIEVESIQVDISSCTNNIAFNYLQTFDGSNDEILTDRETTVSGTESGSALTGGSLLIDNERITVTYANATANDTKTVYVVVRYRKRSPEATLTMLSS